MSKAKKLSLSNNDTTEIFNYKPKDLIWAKMKGFTPWPAMICEPPLDLLHQQRKATTKCVFFFGTRNFAWIEANNIKPFEGPWKEDLAKVAKPVSFRHAMADIYKYIEEPAEVDAEIDKNCGTANHATEADFDKIRDGLTEDEDNVSNDAAATNEAAPNNGDVAMVVEALVDEVEATEEVTAEEVTAEDVTTEDVAPENVTAEVTADTELTATIITAEEGDVAVPDNVVTTTPTVPVVHHHKSPVKRTPKAKSSAAAVPKQPKSSTSKSTKRRTSHSTHGSSAKRKRQAADTLEYGFDYGDAPISTRTLSAPQSIRRKFNPDSLAFISSSSRRNMNTIALLDRPVITRPETQAIDMNSRSQTLADRDITPSELTFGFLGLGIMGSTIVKDLIYTGHKVVVWNRTIDKCAPFAEAGAEVKDTPMDVVEAADVIFCCVSDPKGAKELVFGNCGVLQLKDLRNKAYVEMSTIDPETSQDIGEGIKQCNGRYLEAQIHGTRQEAEDGMLIILAGGDRTVFEECHSCFKTIAKNTFFLGTEVGNACKVNLILQTILGVSLVGLAEALALADRFSISLNDIIDIFELTSMKSPLLLAKGKEMAKGDFHPQQPLSHMQRDLRLVLNMAENLDQSMPVTGITNEVFKHTKRLGYSEHDSSAVFVRSRF